MSVDSFWPLVLHNKEALKRVALQGISTPSPWLSVFVTEPIINRFNAGR